MLKTSIPHVCRGPWNKKGSRKAIGSPSRGKYYSECMTIPYSVGVVTGPILQTGKWRPRNQLYG